MLTVAMSNQVLIQMSKNLRSQAHADYGYNCYHFGCSWPFDEAALASSFAAPLSSFAAPLSSFAAPLSSFSVPLSSAALLPVAFSSLLSLSFFFLLP